MRHPHTVGRGSAAPCVVADSSGPRLTVAGSGAPLLPSCGSHGSRRVIVSHLLLVPFDQRIADYARDQLRKAARAERRAVITPIHPDVKVTVPNSNNISTTPVREPKKAKPAEKKVRSRDRNGWSNYRRNARKVPTVGTPPKP